MRLIKQNIERKDGSGTATLLPEEPEDMWHAYNLIRPTDLLRSSAMRKIVTESGSGSRSVDRVHTNLTIRVTKLDFDSQAGQLHVAGQVAEENKHVKLGSYHTLDLELHRNFTLEKADGWDSVALDILKESIDQTKKAQLYAVIMSEGLANICLITNHQTLLRQRVETGMPAKRAGSTDHDKALQRFFKTVLDTLLRHLDLANNPDPKPLLLASPGFTASTFQQHIKTHAHASGAKPLQALLPKITVAHATSAHLHSLAEILASPAVTKRLADAKFARETALMERFAELMRHDDATAWYGPRECEAAVALGAVGKGGGVLMISDSLFRSQEVAVRKRWVALVDSVREAGGEVRVLSSMHESGKRLEALGSVAAILTFPVEGLDEEIKGKGEGEGGDWEGGDGVRANWVDGGNAVNGIEGRRERDEEIEI